MPVITFNLGNFLHASDLPVASKPSVSMKIIEAGWPSTTTGCGCPHTQIPLVWVLRVWPTSNPSSAHPALYVAYEAVPGGTTAVVKRIKNPQRWMWHAAFG